MFSQNRYQPILTEFSGCFPHAEGYHEIQIMLKKIMEYRGRINKLIIKKYYLPFNSKSHTLLQF